MDTSSVANLRWAASFVLETAVFLLAARRKAFKTLPLFTAYLALLVISEMARWSAFRFTGIDSRFSFDAYWTTQGLLVSFRALVVYEICRALLFRYAGVWHLCRPLLFAVAVMLLSASAFAARQSSHHVAAAILISERGLEMTVVAILLFGLAFCRYYGIKIERHLLWIGLGLGFYSAIEVANNTFMQYWLIGFFNVWENLRLVSFNIASVCWLVALLRPLPAPQPAPLLLTGGEYRNLTPQVTARLRSLNARLLEMWK